MKLTDTKKKQVNILILEDEIFYNNLLNKKFVFLSQNPNISIRFNIDISQFTNPAAFLIKVSELDNNIITIVIIDYYLGYGITGLDIVYLLKEINKNIKVILMSQSEKVIQDLDQSIWYNKNFIKMVKHEYAPEVCYTIVENHIKKL